jgi:OFA family oxalate/formate antiporter-like MFS transporter
VGVRDLRRTDLPDLGEIYSLFPSTCTDSFGPKYATTNLSLLYTAKGVAAFLVPLTNVIKAATGNWHMVFLVTALMNFFVVALALFVLRPLRLQSSESQPAYRPVGAE